MVVKQTHKQGGQQLQQTQRAAWFQPQLRDLGRAEGGGVAGEEGLPDFSSCSGGVWGPVAKMTEGVAAQELQRLTWQQGMGYCKPCLHSGDKVCCWGARRESSYASNEKVERMPHRFRTNAARSMYSAHEHYQLSQKGLLLYSLSINPNNDAGVSY